MMLTNNIASFEQLGPGNEMILPPVILYWQWCDQSYHFFLMLIAKLLPILGTF